MIILTETQLLSLQVMLNGIFLICQLSVVYITGTEFELGNTISSHMRPYKVQNKLANI